MGRKERQSTTTTTTTTTNTEAGEFGKARTFSRTLAQQVNYARAHNFFAEKVVTVMTSFRQAHGRTYARGSSSGRVAEHHLTVGAVQVLGQLGAAQEPRQRLPLHGYRHRSRTNSGLGTVTATRGTAS
jgi:hypothetical protein